MGSGASSTTATTSLVLGAAPTTGVFGSNATATATLKRGTTAIVGQPVTFSIGGAQAVGVTNASGVANATVPLTSVPGGYLLSAGFAGDATLLPSGDSHPFTITKLGTTLTLSGPASVPTGTPSGVVATLNAGTAPIAFKTVWFVLTGPTTITTTVLTDLAGKAALGTPAGPVGTYWVTACFDKPSPQGLCPLSVASDDHYLGSGAAVIWPFAGFLQPVDNLPTINTAAAGQAIPVKFSLGGNRGLSIFATNYPKATIDTCTSSSLDDIETFAAANASGLQYDASSGQYTYVWKTDKATMAGKCVRLDLKFIDGSTYTAQFKFK